MTSKPDQLELDIGEAVAGARRIRAAVVKCPCGADALPGSSRRLCLKCSRIAAERAERWAALQTHKQGKGR